MSHSLSTKAKCASAASQQQLLAKVKVEVKEEPVDNFDDDTPLAVMHGVIPRAITHSNNSNKKKQTVAKSVAAAQREPRVYKTSQQRRDKLQQNWFDRTFAPKKAISIGDDKLPDPRRAYTDAELLAFKSAGHVFYSQFKMDAVPLTMVTKNNLPDFHVWAYVLNAIRPEIDKGEWMQVVIKTTFCARGKCDSGVIARIDGTCFPGYRQKHFLKLCSKLIWLIPKTPQEILAPHMEDIQRRREILLQQEAAQHE